MITVETPFNPKADYALEIIRLTKPLHFLGVDLQTNKEELFKQAQSLTKEFAGVQEKITHRSYPDVTAVISFVPDEEGNFRYFIGQLVEKYEKNSTLKTAEVFPGLYARLKIKGKPYWWLGYRLAQVRKTFYQKFLPGSGFEKAENMDEIELYDPEYKKHPLKRPAMYLLIPIKSQGRKNEVKA